MRAGESIRWQFDCLVRLVLSVIVAGAGSEDMQRYHRIAVRFIGPMVLSLGVAACSSDSSTGSLLPQPDSILKRPDWATFSGAKGEFSLRPVSSEDLVSADGQCAGAGPAAGS